MTKVLGLTLSVFLAVVLLVSTATSAADVSARASVDSTHYLIGDWIVIHINIVHPRGITIQPPAGDSVAGFLILQHRPLTKKSDTLTATDLVVARYDSVSTEFPPLPLHYYLAGDSAAHTVFTNPLHLTVSTVAVDTTKEMADLKPPMAIPMSLAEIAMYLGIVLFCAGLAYLLYRYWKKRKEHRAGQVYVPPLRPAHVIALEELAMLKGRKLWQQGHIKEFYTEITEILRRYIENRYQLMALEKTTDEIMGGLRSVPVAPEVLPPLETILRRADLVKFAKYQPGIPEHEEMFTVAYDLIDRTKFIPVVAAEPVEAKSDVGS